jgi:signal transduction histidine kinase
MAAPSASPGLSLPAAAPRRWPLPRTLRGKGVLAMAAALVYALGAAVYLTSLRGGLQDDVATLDRLHTYERMLAKAEVAVSSASLEVQEATFAPLLAEMSPTRAIALTVEGAQRAVEGLVDHNAAAERSLRAIVRAKTALEAQPVRSTWIELRDVLRRVQEEVAIERDRAALERQAVTERYQARFGDVTRISYLLLLIGVAAFGALVVVFFTRMTRDIGRLQARASQIVRGERQPPLAVNRDDELGQLTRALNAMADDLDSRARQLELEQQRHAHQEKMATLGALAASVAHEVNNPLMAIAGVAQELAASDGGLSAGDAEKRARQLLGEVHRLATVTRQISHVATPRADNLAWLDVNGLLRPMLQFLRYDKRFRGAEFVLALDPQLPAARALADPVELVMLRLLNEVSAAVVSNHSAGGRITLRTRHATAPEPGAAALAVVVEIVAEGMPPRAAAVDHAVEVCGSIIASLGGELAQQRDGHGVCSIMLRLPAEDAAALAQ